MVTIWIFKTDDVFECNVLLHERIGQNVTMLQQIQYRCGVVAETNEIKQKKNAGVSQKVYNKFYCLYCVLSLYIPVLIMKHK